MAVEYEETGAQDLRFSSGQKFLWGFLAFFFCLFLESESLEPSLSSSALFILTAFTSGALCPFSCPGSFGLEHKRPSGSSQRLTASEHEDFFGDD